MPALRLSIMVPQPGQRAQVERLLDHLEELLAKHPGYIAGGRFAAADTSQEVGRIGIWRSHAEADHAATDDDVIAVRSQIHELVQPGHLERLYDTVGDSALARVHAS
ncbi:MAG: hypothetical protein HY689_08720 [Chloroflexi bacterium]|nr:hypothetical protein [Chloroflexota bacterium]